MILLGALAALFIGMGGTIWWLNWSLESAQATIAARNEEIEKLRREAAVQQTMTEIRAQIAEAVHQATREAEERARQTQEAITVIDQAPDSDDGPVAPVLDRTLDSFRRGR